MLDYFLKFFWVKQTKCIAYTNYFTINNLASDKTIKIALSNEIYLCDSQVILCYNIVQYCNRLQYQEKQRLFPLMNIQRSTFTNVSLTKMKYRNES